MTQRKVVTPKELPTPESYPDREERAIGLARYFTMKLEEALPGSSCCTRFGFRVTATHYGGKKYIRCYLHSVRKGMHLLVRAISFPEPKTGFDEKFVMSRLLPFAEASKKAATERDEQLQTEEAVYQLRVKLGLDRVKLKHLAEYTTVPTFSLSFVTEDMAELERAAKYLEDFLKRTGP